MTCSTRKSTPYFKAPHSEHSRSHDHGRRGRQPVSLAAEYAGEAGDEHGGRSGQFGAVFRAHGMQIEKDGEHPGQGKAEQRVVLAERTARRTEECHEPERPQTRLLAAPLPFQADQ